MNTFKVKEFAYRGAIENLSKILTLENVKKALVFTGKQSFENINSLITKQFDMCDVMYFNDFSTNPNDNDLVKAIKRIDFKYDIIISIGGGSVIDFSKAFKHQKKDKVKTIAIPTTCGTGSESTQFAVLYKNNEKYSLDEPSLLPEYVILDSQFVENSPRYLKACTAMDAYCQGIESYWAKKATNTSKEYAIKCIILCRDNIVKYVNSTDINSASNMMTAANLSGKAINISKTTASHALSYKFTTLYGIPHGHAVALTIPYLFDLNTKIEELNLLKELITDNPINYFHELYNDIGLEYNFEKLHITDINKIIKGVNVERLKNNPINLTEKDLMKLLGVQTPEFYNTT